jgi:6-phosphofructokinase 2
MGDRVLTVTLNPCIDKTFTVERVAPERKLRGFDVRSYPGGGGINVARAATELGADALALWSCGGPIGTQLARMLDAEGVSHEPVPIDGETRENLIVSDQSSRQQFRFGMPGPTLDARELDRWRDAVLVHVQRAQWLVLSGSLPPEVAPEWYADLIRAASGHARVIVDIKQPTLRHALDVGVFLVKPNLNELNEIAGRELSDDDEAVSAARALIDDGSASAVLVSLGSAGAMLVDSDAATHVRAPTVPRRSRVGAGDSTVGGLVARLAQGASLEDAARFGVAAGAASVMTPGTALCRRDDTERLYAQMTR